MSRKGKDEPNIKDPGRRNLLKAGAAAGISAALGGPPVAHADGRQGGGHRGRRSRDRELTLVNGRIHTMDDRNSVVSSVTIRNGRFESVSGWGWNSGGR